MFVDFLKCFIVFDFEFFNDGDVCFVLIVFLVCIVCVDGDYVQVEIDCIDWIIVVCYGFLVFEVIVLCKEVEILEIEVFDIVCFICVIKDVVFFEGCIVVIESLW